jgi:hypothetical protein
MGREVRRGVPLRPGSAAEQRRQQARDLLLLPGTPRGGSPMAEQPKAKATRTPAGSASHPPLEERTTEELYALAAELRIAGHTEMGRSELIEAIRRR